MCEAEKLSQGPRWEKLTQDIFKEQKNLGYSHTQAAFSRCIFCMLPLLGPKSSIGLLSVCSAEWGTVGHCALWGRRGFLSHVRPISPFEAHFKCST